MSTSGATSSRRASATLINSIQVNPHSDEKRPSNGFMDRFFRLFPSWSPSTTKTADQDAKTSSRNGVDQLENGPGSVLSLHPANTRILLGKSKPLLHTKSTPSCHQTLTRSSGTGRSHQGSPVTTKSAREFNSSILDRLFAASGEDRRKSAAEIIFSSPHGLPRPSPALTPRQEPVFFGNGSIDNRNLTVVDTKLVSISPLLHKFKLRTAGVQSVAIQDGPCGHKFLRNHESDPIKIVERKSAVFRDYNGSIAGRRRSRLRADGDDEIDGQERLANTWPLAGYHIDYGEFLF